MRHVPVVLALVALYPAQAQEFSVTRRQQDLNYVATRVPKLHANFFYQLDPTVFQQAVDSLTAKIGTLTDAEFYVQLAALIALAGDPHTAIYLTGNQALQAGFQAFPMQLRWLDDGLFVAAASPDYTLALGAQVVAVGGTPLDQVMQKLATVIPHANDQWLHYVAQQYLTGQQILEGLDIVPAGATSALTFRTLSGNEFTLNLAPVSGTLVSNPSAVNGPIPDYLTNTGSFYWYEYLNGQRLLYFKYNVCEDDPSDPFVAFTTRLMSTIDTNPVDSLVIDFRGNTGGSTHLFDQFGAELARRLPTLMMNGSFRIYIVIDKGTFSSGLDDAMQFKSSDLAAELQTLGLSPNINLASRILVIGEPTGGKPSGYGEVVAFTLPASGLLGQYSTQFVPAPPGIPDTPSFAPDIPVGLRSTDYFARYDPLLAAIIGRQSAPVPAPSGTAVTVNAASFRADQGTAPGSIATALGTFSTVPDQVLVGAETAKPLSSTQSQVFFIVPASAPTGLAAISIRAGGTEVASGKVTLTATGPGIFVLNRADRSQPGAVLNQDNSINSALNPAAKGSVIQIFATGYGNLDASGTAPVQVMTGDSQLQVLESVPVLQDPGLWQINAQLPGDAVGQIPVYLVAGNLASNGVTIWIQ